jgi:hypothetical protein
MLTVYEVRDFIDTDELGSTPYRGKFSSVEVLAVVLSKIQGFWHVI